MSRISILEASPILAAGNQIGESPLWDGEQQRLLWVDHAEGWVAEARPQGQEWGETRRWAFDCHIAAALPRLGGGFVLAGQDDLRCVDNDDSDLPFARLPLNSGELRMNDAKCDPMGRIWATTLSVEFLPKGGLYRIDPDGSVHRMLGDARLANGFAWSADGRSFYFADSLAGRIDAFDFDMVSGALGGRRTFVIVDPAGGLPNGMTADRQGGLWVAFTCGGEVRRYLPDGSLDMRVRISVPGVTSCAFGGADGATLFITSRAGRVPEIVRTIGVNEAGLESSGSEAGALFACRPGYSGDPAELYRG